MLCNEIVFISFSVSNIEKSMPKKSAFSTSRFYLHSNSIQMAAEEDKLKEVIGHTK
ncbi:MAG: hypothetical protein ACI857_000136 [Arenicella sp.]